VSITDAGLSVVALLTLRFITAISFAALLSMTTPWNLLLHGLRRLLIPRAFVAVLSMTYRYIAVMLKSAAETITARRSRAFGAPTSARNRRFLGGMTASLFRRAQTLSEEVHA